MSREIRYVVMDPEGLQIVVTAPGGYNPDQLEDVKRRAMDGYREALAFRVQVGLYPQYGSDDDEVPDLEEDGASGGGVDRDSDDGG